MRECSTANSETIIPMFKAAEIAFSKHIKGRPEFHKRKNFLHYNYTICKLQGILSESEEDKTPIKVERILKRLDTMWNTICLHCDWPFVPSTRQ